MHTYISIIKKDVAELWVSIMNSAVKVIFFFCISTRVTDINIKTRKHNYIRSKQPRYLNSKIKTVYYILLYLIVNKILRIIPIKLVTRG